MVDTGVISNVGKGGITIGSVGASVKFKHPGTVLVTTEVGCIVWGIEVGDVGKEVG
jgi:hypothetical protein